MKRRANHRTVVALLATLLALNSSGCRTLITREEFTRFPSHVGEIRDNFGIYPVCDYEVRERWLPWIYLSQKSIAPLSIGLITVRGDSQSASNTLVITEMFLEQGTNRVHLVPTNAAIRTEFEEGRAEYTVRMMDGGNVNFQETFTLGVSGSIEGDGKAVEVSINKDMKPHHGIQYSWFRHLLDL